MCSKPAAGFTRFFGLRSFRAGSDGLPPLLTGRKGLFAGSRSFSALVGPGCRSRIEVFRGFSTTLRGGGLASLSKGVRALAQPCRNFASDHAALRPDINSLMILLACSDSENLTEVASVTVRLGRSHSPSRKLQQS